jgi:serine/threonine-protein kinase
MPNEGATLSVVQVPVANETLTFPPAPNFPTSERVTVGLADPANVIPFTHRVSIPGYEILGILGRGAMGVVYKARHLKLNRVVALKMILAGSHSSAKERVRFLSEAEAVAKLDHPNIVRLHEIGTHEGHPFFTLEYVEGGTLIDKVRDNPMTASEAATLVERIARGVACAHGNGIVHRDLKPENVLIGKDGTPRITDFGLAKRAESGEGLTASGAIMGTPSYMAPEQASGRTKEVGPAADVWALGATLYRLVTGRPPFHAATPIDTMKQVVDEEPLFVRQLAPIVPADVETICHKCLQKDPAKRYTTANDLAEDLRRWLDGEPILARPVGPIERTIKMVKRNPEVAGLLSALFIVLSVGLGISL